MQTQTAERPDRSLPLALGLLGNQRAAPGPACSLQANVNMEHLFPPAPQVPQWQGVGLPQGWVQH